MNSFWQDLRYAGRLLAKSPGFAAVAILTLALGIGANTVVFSLCDRFLLRPLPYPDANRLFVVWHVDPNNERTTFSPADYLSFKEQVQTFDSLAAYEYADGVLDGGRLPERLFGLRVSGNFFHAVKVQAMLGRVLGPEDCQPGRDDVVVLSHRFWQNHFSRETDALGRTVKIDGHSLSVIGILPPQFDRFLQFRRTDVWRPLVLTAGDVADRPHHDLRFLGHLRAGMSQQQATVELNTVAERLASQRPEVRRGSRVELVLLRKAARGAPEPLLLLTGAVVALLLVACVNLANLLLARATGRDREMALRAAMGASRWRLIRQLLAESLVLAVLGGIVGLFVALWAQHVITATIYLQGDQQLALKLNYLMFGFNCAVSLLTGILCGLVPALRASKTELGRPLREGTRGLTAGRQHKLARSVLVGTEVALAVILLTCGGLFLRGILRLESLQPGFEIHRQLLARLSLPEAKYSGASQRIGFFQQLVERIEALPGVVHASIATGVPLKSGIGTLPIYAEAGSPEARQHPLQVNYDAVGPHYFQTLGIVLLRGRGFTDTDAPPGTSVAIVNETLARQFWPNRDPLGQRLAEAGDQPTRWLTVVGVVRDVRYPANFINPEPAAHVYLPYAQLPWPWTTLIVRSSQDLTPLIGAVRRAVKELDPELPVDDIEPLDQALAHGRNNFQVLTGLLGIFAGIGFLLALLGVYGAVAYDVSQRNHELGVRAALGAQQNELLRLVTRQGMLPVAMGLLIGAAGAWAVARLLGSLLPSLAHTAPAVLAGTALGLSIAACLACVIPARRATKVDPMVALRYE
jgi:putative ABC transport system permease protein